MFESPNPKIWSMYKMELVYIICTWESKIVKNRFDGKKKCSFYVDL